MGTKYPCTRGYTTRWAQIRVWVCARGSGYDYKPNGPAPLPPPHPPGAPRGAPCPSAAPLAASRHGLAHRRSALSPLPVPTLPLSLLGCVACASREWPRRNGPSWPRVAAWRIGSAPPSSSGYHRLRRAELRVAPLPTQLAARLSPLEQHSPRSTASSPSMLASGPLPLPGRCGDLAALVPGGRDRSPPSWESSAPWTGRHRELFTMSFSSSRVAGSGMISCPLRVAGADAGIDFGSRVRGGPWTEVEEGGGRNPTSSLTGGQGGGVGEQEETELYLFVRSDGAGGAQRGIAHSGRRCTSEFGRRRAGRGASPRHKEGPPEGGGWGGAPCPCSCGASSQAPRAVRRPWPYHAAPPGRAAAEAGPAGRRAWRWGGWRSRRPEVGRAGGWRPTVGLVGGRGRRRQGGRWGRQRSDLG
ncbi:hypothetical protein PVAP13_9KG239613 [Panicum virgatum]|uniref:Uncharacterized protein n=1 Tax=Panicum virgatum TaxID=38727 RepID=A0A8T0NS97_PANVG|nr:hypothetical protein PVAP13_9KG239613 [Panicum virgatum]